MMHETLAMKWLAAILLLLSACARPVGATALHSARYRAVDPLPGGPSTGYRPSSVELYESQRDFDACAGERSLAVKFELDSSEVDASDELPLTRLARCLATAEYQDREIVLTGYTDPIGDADYNERLALARAASIRSILIDNGVSPDRIRIVSGGEEQREGVAPAESRRVEIELR